MTERCDECDGSGHKRGSGWEGERTELGAVPPVPEAPERPTIQSGDQIRQVTAMVLGGRSWPAGEQWGAEAVDGDRVKVLDEWLQMSDFYLASQGEGRDEPHAYQPFGSPHSEPLRCRVCDSDQSDPVHDDELRAEPVAPVQDEPAAALTDSQRERFEAAAARGLAVNREKHLRRLLTDVVVAADRMRNDWAEGDDAVKGSLWRKLHSAAMAAETEVYPLAGEAAPEPLAVQDEGRDEAATDQRYLWLHGARESLCSAQTHLDNDDDDDDRAALGIAVAMIDRVGSKLAAWSKHDRDHELAEPVPVPVAPPEPPRPSHVKLRVTTFGLDAGETLPVDHWSDESPVVVAWDVHRRLEPDEWEPVEPVPSTPPSETVAVELPRAFVERRGADPTKVGGRHHSGDGVLLDAACAVALAASPPVPSATVTNELSDEQLGGER
jgi:hypothetical protein